LMQVVSLSLTLSVPITGVAYTKVVSGDQVNPIPFVNAPLVPDSATPGGSDFKLTVNGTGFVSGSGVLWNGAALATTFVSLSQLTAVVPAADIATAVTASVSVSNPMPGGGVSNFALFSIRAPFSAASFGQNFMPSGKEPAWIAAADLNGDGKLDLATAVFQDNAVAVSLGNGDGTFQSSIEYPVAGRVIQVIAADLNGDGKLDLAASTWGGSVSVLLGNGDGTFQPRKDAAVGADTEEQLLAADFNQDSKLDIAVSLDSGLVAVLLGNGDGTFQPAADYRVDSGKAQGITAGDFNQDGRVDIAAVAGFDSAVSILLGKGDGTFQSAVEYPTRSGGTSLVAADLNQDGRLDLAIETEFEWLSVLLGNGDGTFAPHMDQKIQPGVYGMALADLNGDGIPDLLIPGIKTISTFTGRGDGTFSNRSDFAVGTSPLGIAVGDLDGDGMLDIAVPNSQSDNISILPQVTAVLSRTYLKFGNVKVGDSSKLKAILSNIGNQTLTIQHIGLAGQAEGYAENNNCRSSLMPGASCKITIVFQPTGLNKYKHAKVKVVTSAVNGPQEIYLQGTGTN